MPDLESALRRELASRTARPAPAGLMTRILDATTRRAPAPAGQLWATRFAVALAVVAVVALSYPMAILWTRPSGSGPARLVEAPSPRDDPSLAYDAARGVVVLFGGYGPTDVYPEDTLTWGRRTGWSRLEPAHHPAGRSHALMAYDEAHHVVVLFGGYDGHVGSNSLADTWTWDGRDWTQAASTGPGFGYPAAMAYDAAYGQVLLVTPGQGPARAAQTWTWDGGAWRQITTAGPNLQRSAAMALDRATGRVVLLSSPVEEDVIYPGSPETWVWGPGGWVQAHPSSTPQIAGGSLATDPTSGHVVALGYGPSAWTWTGVDWRQSAVGAGGPVGCACAAGDVRDGLILHFGGHPLMVANSVPHEYETWAWTPTGGWRVLAP